LIRVLFVCTGNICRSPTAEGVLRVRADAAGLNCEVASAGMGGWHVGEAPDERSMQAALSKGYDLSAQSAQQVEPEDFHRYDHIIAMDQGHLRQLKNVPHQGGAAHISLMMDWAGGERGIDVPDPYYGEGDGFKTVLEMIEVAVDGFIEQASS
jgi:protein-tyrosine phosphatase